MFEEKKCYYIPWTKSRGFRCTSENFSGALAPAKGAGAPEVLSKTAILCNLVQGDGIFQTWGLNKV